ncbi:Planctomycete cytochrome C [Rubripirellula tenax]|uniref:Planctomycete cytochrome C n=1 Tax=Rubripirellula tenax TaxID=2528015 RepID=A0A5C6FJP8_9BACT|nr:PSD1 and planctomycete cytochrome C domain-containing protein [Rubripirellula tenax]TWU60327.1 Planctomycete cytochrome C [Rubripirellula tenax]
MPDRFVRVSATIVFLILVGGSENAAANDVDFARDIRPILSDHCFACHGPDEAERAADLRLDTADGLAAVVDSDDVDASEMLRRIVSDDVDEVMPPPEYHKPLTEDQRTMLRTWIVDGAQFQSHWAFVAPQVPSETSQTIASGAKQIDGFIEAAVAEAGLTVNDRADRRTLLRRVCLDLTGLPPTREQIDAFVNDTSPDAYSNLVDRLLQSRHFGQHVGRYWLDLVRYGDTHGLHLDNFREMWSYRDWVIDAINANMPFDQFITHQLAGDLLPDATDKERIASGFNRLNVSTSEGGSIYDEVFARNCIDRTDAFGTIFLGLTTGCAVCHDHKFDPISQRDYYSLLSFFNSLDGKALDGNAKDHPPSLKVPSPEQVTMLAEYKELLTSLEAEKEGPIPSIDEAQATWEQSLSSDKVTKFESLHPTEVVSESGATMKALPDGTVELVGDPSAKDVTVIVASIPSGIQWQTIYLEAIVDDPEGRAGASTNGNAVLSEITVETTDASASGQWIQVPIAGGFADIEQDGDGFAFSNAIDGKLDADKGWAIAGHEKTGGRSAWLSAPSLIADGADAKIRVTLKYQSKFAGHQFRKVRLSLSDAAASVPPSQQVKRGGIHVVGPFPIETPNPGYNKSYASQQKAFNADEVFEYEERSYRWQHRGDLNEVEVNPLPTIDDRLSVTLMHQTIQSPRDQSITLLIGADDGHVVYLGDKEVGRRKGAGKHDPLRHEYELPLKKGDNDLYIKLVNHAGENEWTYAFRSPAIRVPEHLRQLVKTPVDQRSDDVRTSLGKYFRKVACLHPDWLALIDQERGTRSALEKLEGEIPTTLVWKELAEPRQAHLLLRGQYDQPGDEVPRATPSFLPPFPDDAPKDRLGLAKWLTLPEHPLTARVAVNRFWQQVFGIGLVKTSEDFGSQGQPPSHPELLNWLAVDFQANGWDVKRLLKTLVMTDAYQRSAKVVDGMLRIDPNNRLLARGPRHRLDAEVLRDQSLALAGLLVDTEGGPSVKPPQPAGLWEAVGYSGSNTVNFKADEGEKVNRRSLYIFWKRTSAPPQMSTLDAPSRESCTARRERTNTPLQALLLMNEEQYLASAKMLARRAMTEPKVDNEADRIRWAFETVTARLPSTEEADEMLTLVEDMAAYYDQHPELAVKLTGQSDVREAAWTILASTLLNLDETVTK